MVEVFVAFGVGCCVALIEEFLFDFFFLFLVVEEEELEFAVVDVMAGVGGWMGVW